MEGIHRLPRKRLKNRSAGLQEEKKETFFVSVDYEINPGGSVNILNVASTPENALIQSEVRNRMELTPLQLRRFWTAITNHVRLRGSKF
jgi:hypothetical protein